MSHERLLRLTAWGERPGEGCYDLHHPVSVLYTFRSVRGDRDYVVVEEDPRGPGVILTMVVTPRDGVRWTWPSRGQAQYVDGWDVTGSSAYESGGGSAPPEGTPSLYVVHDGGLRERPPGLLHRRTSRGLDHLLLRADALRRRRRS